LFKFFHKVGSVSRLLYLICAVTLRASTFILLIHVYRVIMSLICVNLFKFGSGSMKLRRH